MTKAAMPEFGEDPPANDRGDFGSANRTGRFAALNLAAANLPPILTSNVGETGLTREQEYGRMLKTLVSNVPGLVYRCRNDADWTMEFVSDGCERLTGYRASDVLLNHRIRFEDIIHPDDRGLMHKAMAKVQGGSMPFDVEYRIICADSTVRWVWERGIGVYDGSPQPIAYEGLIQDITVRKLAEQAVVEAERRYRGLFDNAI
jgi:PAS domain S-box-containing protein